MRSSHWIVLGLALAALSLVVWSFESEFQFEPNPERSLDQILQSQDASLRFINALNRESEQRWLGIHWRSIDDALKSSASTGKPILVLLSVREIGTQDPGRC